jgi:protein O-mannosyl-transferase
MAAGWKSAALVFFLSVAVYGPGLGDAFHYDDFHSIVLNPHLRSWERVVDFFVDPALFSANPTGAMYRPLLLVTYVANFTVGDSALGFRWANLVIHACNSMLVGWFLAQLTRRPSLAWGAALFFALTPLNSEAVHYVSSRSELLMALGVLAACGCYIRWHRHGQWVWYALALAATAAALMSKAVAVVIPALLFLCDAYMVGTVKALRRWKGIIPFVGLGMGYWALTRPLVDKALGQPVRSWDLQIWTQAKALVYYWDLAVLPTHLSVAPQFFVAKTWGGAVGFSMGLALILALVLTIGVIGKGRTGRFLVGWAGLTLLPTSVVPLYVLVNEHRLYLAGLAWALGMSLALGQIGGAHMAGRLRAAYTICLALLLVERGPVWADELSVWRDAQVKGPLMLKPHLRLADELARRGDRQAAESAYLKALALVPEHLAARNNLARLYLRSGNAAAAAIHLDRLVEVYPNNVPALLNLANAMGAMRRWDEAEEAGRRVLRLESGHAAAHKLLGTIALQVRQDPEAALDHLSRVLAVDADDVMSELQRGVAYKQLGRSAEAEKSYRRALALKPDLADGWYNLGNLLEGAGRLREALDAFTKAASDNGDVGKKALERITQLNEIE